MLYSIYTYVLCQIFLSIRQLTLEEGGIEGHYSHFMEVETEASV